MSLRWSGIEARTHGLIHGPATLASDAPAAARLWTPRRELRRLLERREFFAGDLVPAATNCWWKLVVSAREGGEILWQRPFVDRDEALLCYLRARGFELDRWNGDPIWCPNDYVDGELHIQLFDVATYNSTNSTNADWPTGNKCPSGVTATDYLVVAGGASGGANQGGGGAAGGMLTSTAYAVTAGTQYTITVGTSVSGVTGTNNGTAGNNSVFDTNTATGGGRGATFTVNGGNGGSGGGGSNTGLGGTGTGGQGSNGGNGSNSGGDGTGGGGGGATSVGGNGSGNSPGGNGGNGTASSISGSSVTYAGGGGGGGNAAGGSAGSGGGGAGASAGNNGTAGTANRGGGGGGSYSSANTSGGGAAGVVILSFVPAGQPMVKRRGGVPFTSPNSRVW